MTNAVLRLLPKLYRGLPPGSICFSINRRYMTISMECCIVKKMFQNFSPKILYDHVVRKVMTSAEIVTPQKEGDIWLWISASHALHDSINKNSMSWLLNVTFQSTLDKQLCFFFQVYTDTNLINTIKIIRMQSMSRLILKLWAEEIRSSYSS